MKKRTFLLTFFISISMFSQKIDGLNKPENSIALVETQKAGNNIENEDIKGETIDSFKNTIIYHFEGKTTSDSLHNKEETTMKALNKVKQNENCISGDCMNGYGKYKYSDGGSVVGFFTNGKSNGFAILTYANGDDYSGNFVDGKKEGFGIYRWKVTNTQYYGEWKNDKIHGYGYIITDNNTTQAGVYENGELTTNLFEDYKSNKITRDNCLGNCINGYGTLKSTNGDIFTGFFLNGKIYKAGNQYLKEQNSTYIGQINSNGQYNGMGMFVTSNLIYFGNIINGKLTGRGVKTDKITLKQTAAEFDNGFIKKDYIINESNNSNTLTTDTNCISGNCIDGYGEFKTTTGTLLKGFFLNGKLNGYAVQTFPNGDNYSGNFVDGKKEGFGIYKWPATNTDYYGEWKNDVINGYGYLTTNSTITQGGIYVDGKQKTDLLIDYKNKKTPRINCVGNCSNGYGSYQYENGDFYAGFFINNKPSKIGFRKWKKTNIVYTGLFNVNGQPTGTGMFMYSNSMYIGEINNEKPTGRGVKMDLTTYNEIYGEFNNGILVKDYSLKENINSNTTTNTATTTTCVSGNCTEGYGKLKTVHSTITGFFSGGKANGYGKEVFSDNSGHYEGKFERGKRGGFGMYTWNNDQSYYIGEWKDGKQHGYGYLKKGSEILQAGYYENGKQTQNMLESYKNKQASGNCVGDCNNGFGYYKYSDSSVYVGFFTNGQINNIGAYTWSSGDVFIGEIFNGQLSGQGVVFYKSAGTTYYGNLSNGIRQGMGAYFNKSGAIESKGFWDKGILKTSY